MAAREKHYLTDDGFKKIKADLQKLKEARLEKIRVNSSQSFRFGDVNPEYLAFQEEMGQLDNKISELENILEDYELIKPPANNRGLVCLGARVLVEMDGEIENFSIVSTVEADPSQNKISDQSPIGAALLGKKVGEKIEVKTPIVSYVCKIIRVSY
jgi:transcription elongation factor GreA